MSSQSFSRNYARDISSINKMLYHIAWNCDGTYLAGTASDRSVRVYQLDNLESKPMMASSLQSVHSIPTSQIMTKLAWHPFESGRIAICGDDKTIEIWDVRYVCKKITDEDCCLFTK